MDPCGREVLDEARDPDGERTAIAYRTDCGATTPFVTSIGFRSMAKPVSLQDVEPFFSMKGSHSVDLLWEKKSFLDGKPNPLTVVVHTESEEIYRQATVWDRVPIWYVDRPPAGVRRPQSP